MTPSLSQDGGESGHAAPRRRRGLPIRHTAVALFTGWVVTSLALPASAQSAAPSRRHSQHGHVHGEARLGVAIQDKTVTIEFAAPLDSVLGFEHRPRTPAQRQAADALLARLKSAQDLFRFDAAAGCVLTRSGVAADALEAPAPATSAASAAAGKGAGAAAGNEHAELEASLEFTCTQPERLAAVEIGLFQAFARLRRLDVDVASAKGQWKRSLTRPERTLRLTR